MAFRAPEISPGRSTATATLRLGTNGFAFLGILPLCGYSFFSLSLISGNRFHLFGIYRIFSFNWEFKNGFGSRVVHFGSDDSL